MQNRGRSELADRGMFVVEDVLRELELFDEAIKIGDENPYSKPEGVK